MLGTLCIIHYKAFYALCHSHELIFDNMLNNLSINKAHITNDIYYNIRKY